MHTDYNMEQQEHHQNIHKECVCVRKRPGPRHIETWVSPTRMIGDLGHHHSVIDVHRELARSRDDSDLLFFLLLILMCNTGWFNCHTERRAFILKCHKEKLNCIIMIFTIFLLIGAAAHIVCGWLKIQKKFFLYNLVQKIISFHYYS